jgi:hypothetical protein
VSKRCLSAQPDNRDGDAADLNRSKKDAEERSGENRDRHRRRQVINGDDRFVTLRACDPKCLRAVARAAR